MAVTKLEARYDPERFLSHFFLVEEPFALTPDPRFLYLSRGHANALAEIDNGVTDHRGLIVLSGEMGTGKTTLAHSILSQWRNQIHVAYIGAGTFTRDDILRRAMVDYGLDPSGGPREWDSRLERLLYEARDEGKLVVLMIDEAQGLSDETFDAITRLLNVGSDEPALVQVVLIGQPELRQRLKEWQERHPQLPTVSHATLGLLSKKESFEYVAHRLQIAGGLPEVFRPEALKLLIRRSQGIPRRLNAMCHNALTIAFLNGAEEIDIDIARRAIEHSAPSGRSMSSRTLQAAAIVLALIAGAVYLLGQWQAGRSPIEPTESAAIEADENPAALQPPVREPGAGSEASTTTDESSLAAESGGTVALAPLQQVIPPEERDSGIPDGENGGPTLESTPSGKAQSAPAAATRTPGIAEQSPSSSIGRSSLVSATEVAVALDVVDRQPRGSGSSFPMDVGRLYLWTRLSTETPTQVEHVWYFADQEQARVALSLGGHWRVWSSKAILPSQVGTWRVDIVDSSGNLVDRVTFETVHPR